MKNFIESLFTDNINFSLKKYYVWLYLFGSVLMTAITISFGPAIGGDSIDYLSTATNLAAGNGFLNYAGRVYITWPPLYPLMLAAVSKLTGLSVYIAGWIINAMLYGYFLIIAGKLFQITLPQKPIWSILATITLMFSFSGAVIFASIAADPIFIILVMLFLIGIQRFMGEVNLLSLVQLGIIAALASLQRWNGVVLILLGLIVIFYTLRDNFKKAVYSCVKFGFIAVLPISIWIVSHNYLITGTLFGKSASPLRGNFTNTFTNYIYPRLVHWMLPVSVSNIIPQFTVIIIVVLACLIIVNAHGFKHIVKELANQKLFPQIIFISIYLPFIALTTILADHPNIFDDRYLVPILVPLLVLLFWLLDKLVNSLKNSRFRGYISNVVIISFLIWLVYPINIVRKLVIQSLNSGPSISNEFNVKRWRDSETIAFIQDNQFNANIPFTSNFPVPLYFFSGESVTRSPLDDHYQPALMENIAISIEEWDGASSSYLVWFIPNCCKDQYDPVQLSTRFNLTLLHSSEDGMIFLMESNQ